VTLREPRDVYREFLRARGEEWTPGHEAVLTAVFEIHDHFTAEDLAGMIEAPVPNPAVEDALFEMVEAGLIRKVYFGTGPVTYEHVHGHVHHDHLYCLGCGRIVEFRDAALEEVQDRVARERGFHVVRHSLQIVGLCEACQAREVPHEHEFAPADEDLTGPAVPLAMVRNGEWVTLTELRGGQEFRRRVASMGLVQGDTFQVLNNAFAGAVVVRVKGGTTLALGHGMSHKVLVRLVERSAANE
jgi:Fur family transcriptional regulator, ferric uptake regulator